MPIATSYAYFEVRVSTIQILATIRANERKERYNRELRRRFWQWCKYADCPTLQRVRGV